MNKGKVSKLEENGAFVEKSAATAKTPADAARMRALEILRNPSA